MRSLLRLAKLAALLLATTTTGQDRSPETHQRLSALLEAYADWGFSGSVLVAQGSAIVLEAGYGYADRMAQKPNSADTRYDFASIAKTFTGAATLALEAEGLIRVSDRLEQHVGEFPDERKATATFHHVATHTAGLAHRSKSELAYGPNRTAFIESMKAAPFESPPGESYRYSNAGGSFLAALVEEISGVPYVQFLRSRFLVPLNLESTQLIPELSPGEMAVGYQDDSATPAPPPYDGDWGWGLEGSTGIISTVRDMFHWFDALYNGDVLPPEQRAKAFDISQDEAYGWHTYRDDADRLCIHKGGGLPAMQAQIRAYPEQGVVMVWAHNSTAHSWRKALNEGISAVALGESFGPVPRIDAGYAPGTRDAPRAGVYATPGGTQLELAVADGAPVLGGNGLGIARGPLAPGQNHDWVLFSPDTVSWIRLSATSDGTLNITQGPEGRELTLKRLDQATATMLAEPNPEILTLARGYAKALMAGDANAVWQATLYRPERGGNSLEDWSKRAGFLGSKVGPEVNVIEEAWALRDGSWRYWRSFESESGARAMVRFQLTTDGQIAGFGMNPVQGAPEADEKRLIQ